MSDPDHHAPNGSENADHRADALPPSPLDDLFALNMPYQPKPGDVSILHGLGVFCRRLRTREQLLALPIRAATIDWLTMALAQASRRPLDEARMRFLEAIPAGCEDILDGGGDFIFAVDQAALMLGCETCMIALRPIATNS